MLYNFKNDLLSNIINGRRLQWFGHVKGTTIELIGKKSYGRTAKALGELFN